ncbi:AAEL012194-PA [Aedes aegypti]|uniref:AAEL012194-PA n=1 Tax=Aedes aegypti TaxID=7159 RepID=Q16MT9_AEDAE|nr:AAEL012194-PA [Aedes aegypti]
MRFITGVVFCLALALAIVGAQRANQEYKECGSACPPTCESIKREPMMCIAQCKSGWFCKSGYVRNAAGMCVKPSQCPK